ncbi:transposase [Streptomyces sp. NPDC050516]|uniref:transposase n=1 Tax=Streptomyces sp. NPDC050516 TaxID=3365621 RepID=UPI003790E996
MQDPESNSATPQLTRVGGQRYCVQLGPDPGKQGNVIDINFDGLTPEDLGIKQVTAQVSELRTRLTDQVFNELHKAGLPAVSLVTAPFVALRGPSRTVQDTELTGQIIAVQARSRGAYGAPRIHAVLNREDTACPGRRVARRWRRWWQSALRTRTSRE